MCGSLHTAARRPPGLCQVLVKFWWSSKVKEKLYPSVVFHPDHFHQPAMWTVSSGCKMENQPRLYSTCKAATTISKTRSVHIVCLSVTTEAYTTHHTCFITFPEVSDFSGVTSELSPLQWLTHRRFLQPQVSWPITTRSLLRQVEMDGRWPQMDWCADSEDSETQQWPEQQNTLHTWGDPGISTRFL